MDPITTSFLAATVITYATHSFRLSKEDRNEYCSPKNELILPDRPKTMLLVAPEIEAPISVSPKESIFNELLSYAPGNANCGNEVTTNTKHIITAMIFIEDLPLDIPLPTPMRNDQGDIGMYWDNDDAYIDINIDGENALSIYTRIRSTGEEKFIDNIALESINSNWAYEHLSAIAAPIAIAA